MENLLKYSSPAASWSDGMPIGNGHLGAMIKGKAGRGSADAEAIDLNEDTLWHGRHKDRNSPIAKENIDKIRELLFEGKIPEAEDLARIAMTSSPKYFGAYEPMGKFIIEEHNPGKITDYERSLDTGTAISEVKYKIDGINVRRRYFASYGFDTIFIFIEADRNILDFSCNLMRRPANEETGSLDENTIKMTSSCGEGGIHFTCLARGTGDGEVKTAGDYLCFHGCSEAMIKITAYSDYNTADPEKKCIETLKKSENLTAEEILRSHIKEYKEVYDRAELCLYGEKHGEDTSERLKKVKNGETDNGLIELYFNFGRYLLISSSRPHTQCMNLQGIWNDSFTPAWESDYTININTEMNYWPAEICSLPEFCEPLFDLIYKMLPGGRRTAEKIYGCPGFTAHHCTDIWGDTAVEGNYFPSPVWPMGAAWLSLHLMEHWEFNRDNDFLRQRAYPVLKECAEFFHAYTVKDPEGYLVTGPSVSPENVYITKDGVKGSLCMGPVMDMEILTELYKAVIKCSEILNTDRAFAETLKSDLQLFRPLKINKYGGLCEWQEDYEEAEPGHRHMSHLFALYPGKEITYKTPELLSACRKTLDRRLSNGGGHTGWSCAWIINFFARLYDGEKALSEIYTLLRKSTYISLLDVHPPFQIDGNMGGTAGIAEMLIMSHTGDISLLPALPRDWEKGYIKGFKARGNFTVSMKWEEGRLLSASIISGSGCDLHLRLPEKYTVSVNGKTEETDSLTLQTYSGETINIKFSV